MKHINRLSALAMLSALALGATQSAQANLLVNGGFDTGDFTGWTRGGNLGFTSVTTGDYGSQSPAYHVHFGPVGSDGTLSQTFADSLGGTYEISWWLAGNGSGFSDFNVYWNGSLVASVGSPIPSQPYTRYSVNVTGTGSDTLLLGFRNDPSFDALDTVGVNAAVPDAGTTSSLLGLAMLGLAAVRRKLS